MPPQFLLSLHRKVVFSIQMCPDKSLCPPVLCKASYTPVHAHTHICPHMHMHARTHARTHTHTQYTHAPVNTYDDACTHTNTLPPCLCYKRAKMNRHHIILAMSHYLLQWKNPSKSDLQKRRHPVFLKDGPLWQYGIVQLK